MKHWLGYVESLACALRSTATTDGEGRTLSVAEGIAAWVELASVIKVSDKVIFFVGNGASASMASHCATDINKNGWLKTQIFTDLSLCTALGNDLGFDRIFAEPLTRNARQGDMLVAISSSGNSPNIMEAVRVARQKQLSIVTLSGMSSDNAIRSMGDLNFWVNSTSYGIVETTHAGILHYLTDKLAQAHEEDIRNGRPAD